MTDLKARAETIKEEMRCGYRRTIEVFALFDDLLARIEELEKGVPAERQRCVDILNAARSGAIDSDLRCIRAWIHGGNEAPKEND